MYGKKCEWDCYESYDNVAEDASFIVAFASLWDWYSIEAVQTGSSRSFSEVVIA